MNAEEGRTRVFRVHIPTTRMQKKKYHPSCLLEQYGVRNDGVLHARIGVPTGKRLMSRVLRNAYWLFTIIQ